MPLPLRMSYNEEITTISLTRPCERSEAIQYHLLVIANVVKQSSITYSSLRTQWSNPVSPTRHCERSEAIQYHLLVTANAVKQSSITRPSLRTQWSNPKNKRIGLQVDRHGFASRWPTTLKPSANTISQLRIYSNCVRTPFHSWEFTQTVCGHHFTAENLLKPSADTISQLGICSNRLRTPFHSGEFR